MLVAPTAKWIGPIAVPNCGIFRKQAGSNFVEVPAIVGRWLLESGYAIAKAPPPANLESAPIAPADPAFSSGAGFVLDPKAPDPKAKKTKPQAASPELVDRSPEIPQ